MKYTITTYADNGDEIVSRNYKSLVQNQIMTAKDYYASQLESK
jgi:hypothetical protein